MFHSGRLLVHVNLSASNMSQKLLKISAVPLEVLLQNDLISNCRNEVGRHC